MVDLYNAGVVPGLEDTVPTNIGIELGRLCAEGKIPITYLAQIIGVTRVAVYKWFQGGDIRLKNRKYVEALVSLIQQDLDAGVLPVKSLSEGKAYLRTMVGMTV